MTSLRIVAIAVALVAFTGPALAAPDAVYHWAYPDGFKGSPTVLHQPFAAESGIPALYR